MIDLDSLPTKLRRYYSLMRDLDKSLQAIQQQNEKRCEMEIEEIRRGIQSGTLAPVASSIRFSDDAIDEQNHSIRIADEKVGIAVSAYDMVDSYVQQLDDYLKKFDSELRQERDLKNAAGASASHPGGGIKSGRGGERSKPGRKKTRLAAATTAAPTPASMDLDLPVDPNEPTYCFCNQVSYGEMIACDNPDCKIEWFHYDCVGLKDPPKGKWYCSSCSGLQKRRKGK